MSDEQIVSLIREEKQMKRLSGPVIAGLVLLLTGVIVISAGKFATRSPVFATGSLFLSPELTASAKGIRTVFIVLYDPDSPLPMPYAAYRQVLKEDAHGQFLDFVLTRENMQLMNPGTEGRMPSKLRVKARLDRSGTAGMDQPGDITGELPEIPTGTENLKIILNKLI